MHLFLNKFNILFRPAHFIFRSHTGKSHITNSLFICKYQSKLRKQAVFINRKLYQCTLFSLPKYLIIFRYNENVFHLTCS